MEAKNMEREGGPFLVIVSLLFLALRVRFEES